jgi:hypothetical protein
LGTRIILFRAFSDKVELVIAGLDPAIHLFRKKMDARVKPAHDAGGLLQFDWNPL